MPVGQLAQHVQRAGDHLRIYTVLDESKQYAEFLFCQASVKQAADLIGSIHSLARHLACALAQHLVLLF